MAEAVACIESIGKSCLQNDIPLNEVTSATQVESFRQDLFQDFMQRAITKAVQEPIAEGNIPSQRDNFMSHSGNPVSERKSLLLSSVDRSGEPHLSKVGDDMAKSGKVASDPLEELSARMRDLYINLTEYKVAWSVGQKVQRDVTHVVKGN